MQVLLQIIPAFLYFNMGIIYKATNSINNKVYIGQTINSLHERFYANYFKGHFYAAKNKLDNYLFHKAIRKYGENAFKIEIIEECDNDKLNEREIYWIKQYNSFMPNGYNMTQGGNSSPYKGRKASDKTKKKQSIAMKKEWQMNREHRVNKIQEVASNISKSVKAYMDSLTNDERKHKFAGTKNMTTEEKNAWKLKISASVKANASTDEHKLKVIASSKTRGKNISMAKRGKKIKPMSEEYKKKRSETMKRYKAQQRLLSLETSPEGQAARSGK